MGRSIYRNVTGFCPTIEDDTTIELEYCEVPILGSSREHFRAVGLDCNCSDNCSEEYCPIMKEHLTIEL